MRARQEARQMSNYFFLMIVVVETLLMTVACFYVRRQKRASLKVVAVVMMVRSWGEILTLVYCKQHPPGYERVVECLWFPWSAIPPLTAATLGWLFMEVHRYKER